MNRNIFKPLKPKSPVRLNANTEDMNFIRNWFNSVEGRGCRVVMDQTKNGFGCAIEVGNGSDTELPPGWPGTGTGDGTHPIFVAEITNVSSAWEFAEQKLVSGTFSDLTDGNERTGTAIEVNGVAAPATGTYTFNALVSTYEDEYYFQLPLPFSETADANKVLRVDSRGIPEWGCIPAT